MNAMDTMPVAGWENCQTYWPGTVPNTFVAATPFNVRSLASMPSTSSLNTTSTSVRSRTTVPGTGVCRAMAGGVRSWATRLSAAAKRASNKQLVRIGGILVTLGSVNGVCLAYCYENVTTFFGLMAGTG